MGVWHVALAPTPTHSLKSRGGLDSTRQAALLIKGRGKSTENGVMRLGRRCTPPKREWWLANGEGGVQGWTAMDEFDDSRETSGEWLRRAEEEFGPERTEELERLRVAVVEAREAALRADEEKFRAYTDAEDAYHEAWKVLSDIEDRLFEEELEADESAFQAEMEELKAKHKADLIQIEQWWDEAEAARREWVQ